MWVATLVQTLRLSENESPFYGNFGIPAQDSVRAQAAPDAAIARTQSQYSGRFASLSISADQTATEPTYNVTVVLNDGTLLEETVAT